ncbi:hypothetical protein [Streptomyces sp. NBC_01198]|uniref:hypothetical protein n=1 Tax=Streptomyces sp. NBC_01198 TaxID=2903769 RepID=UPI002E157DB6|nr:hypothetical protein OG702_00345 [Streptomyces sp. NBC_01198]
MVDDSLQTHGATTEERVGLWRQRTVVGEHVADLADLIEVPRDRLLILPCQVADVVRDLRGVQHAQELAQVGLPNQIPAGLGIQVKALATLLRKALEVPAQFRLQVLTPQTPVCAHPGCQAEPAQPSFQGIDVPICLLVDPWHEELAIEFEVKLLLRVHRPVRSISHRLKLMPTIVPGSCLRGHRP